MLRRKARGGVVCCKKRMNFLEMQLTRRVEMSMMYYVNLRSATEVSDMSLIKCPKCGEMFSDSYKTCPFCEEDEAYYSGKVRKGRGRRTAESSKRRAPSILGPVAVVVLILLVVLVVWLIFGDRIKDAIDGSEKPPITNVDTPDDGAATPDDTVVTPTISLNRTVLVLSIGDKESLKVNGTEETVAWSSSDPTVASVTSSGDVTALAKGNAVITAAVGEESVSCTVTVKSEDDTSGDNNTTTKPNDNTKPSDNTTKPSTGSVDVSKLTLESEYGTTIKPNDGTFDISLPAGLSCSFTVKGTDMTAAWSSADSSIATVSSDGTVKTVSRGETTLTIKLGSTEVKCLLRVTK